MLPLHAVAASTRVLYRGALAGAPDACNDTPLCRSCGGCWVRRGAYDAEPLLQWPACQTGIAVPCQPHAGQEDIVTQTGF
jgi:hypothetical protein